MRPLWGLTVGLLGMGAMVVAVSAQDGAELRDAARLVLERNCATCHTSTYDTALPEALAVFDLSRDDWAVTLTPQAIESIDFRLQAGEGPDGPIDITAEELVVVRQYLASLAIESAPGTQ